MKIVAKLCVPINSGGKLSSLSNVGLKDSLFGLHQLDCNDGLTQAIEVG